MYVPMCGIKMIPILNAACKDVMKHLMYLDVWLNPLFSLSATDIMLLDNYSSDTSHFTHYSGFKRRSSVTFEDQVEQPRKSI